EAERAVAEPGSELAETETAATEASRAAREAAAERDARAEQARTASVRLLAAERAEHVAAQERLAGLVAERSHGEAELTDAALERALAEREGIPPAARALAEEGERLALSVLDVEPGSERAVAAALGPRASAVLAPDARSALALVERAARAGLGSLRVLVGRDPRELVRELPVVAKDELLGSPVPAVTREGYGWDPQRGELWFAG